MAQSRKGQGQGRGRILQLKQAAVSKLTHSTTQPVPFGRLRKYLKDDDPVRHYDPNNEDSPEGRLLRIAEEDWYIPTKDEKGHSADPIRVVLPPALYEELAHLATQIPEAKKSVHALARTAIFELVLLLRRAGGGMPQSNMSRIHALNLNNKHAEVVTGYEEQYQMARKKITDLVLQGATNEARKMAHDQLAIFKQCDVPQLRDKYVALMMQEFTKLFVRGKAVHTNVKKMKMLKKLREKMRKESNEPR